MNILFNCENIPDQLTTITSSIILMIQIIVPILLIIYGMLDFAKVIISNKEDEIKGAYSLFFKRIIAAILVFLVVVLVKFVLDIFTADLSSEAVACIDVFINP